MPFGMKMCRAHLRSHEKYLQEILLGSGKDTKRISSEALSLIGQMAGSTESMEMGKSMEVTNMCTALERLKAEGIEQGMEKGVEKTVISMLKKNYPISEICEITGKTEEEILKIKETM